MPHVPMFRYEYLPVHYEAGDPHSLAKKLTELSEAGWTVSTLDPGYLPEDVVMAQRAIRNDNESRADRVLAAMEFDRNELARADVDEDLTAITPTALRRIVLRVLEEV